MIYDLIIIGAGPAGLAAALDAKYLKLKTLVLDAGVAGGALSQSYPWKGVDSYLGFNNMTGKEVAEKIADHVKSSGADIHEMEEVTDIEGTGPFIVKTEKAEYQANAVIVATGIRGVPRKLSVPGEQLEGVDNQVQDPDKYRGMRVLVVGGGDSAADSAIGLYEAGASVWLAHRRDELRATDENREKLEESKITLLWNTEISSINGDGKVESVSLVNNQTGEKSRLQIDSVILCIGSAPANNCIQSIGVKTENVCIKVDENGMTNIPGIFAAGDIVSKIKRILQALATGEKATYSAYKYIKNPYWK